MSDKPKKIIELVHQLGSIIDNIAEDSESFNSRAYAILVSSIIEKVRALDAEHKRLLRDYCLMHDRLVSLCRAVSAAEPASSYEDKNFAHG